MDPHRRDVAGLTCAEWIPAGKPGRTVLALHGLTSTSQVWAALAGRLPQDRVIAPDLPGRGGSVDRTVGPGLAGHAEAVLRLAGELDLHDVVVVGHSMGAFLAPLVAAGLGDRVRRVVLLDGGVAPERSLLLRRPVVRSLFTVQARLLDRRWRDADAFIDAIDGKPLRHRPDLRPAVREWAAYLLAGTPGALRARIDGGRLIADAVDTLTGDATLGAIAGLSSPVHLVAAARGAHDDAGPFLSDAAVEAGRSAVPRMTTKRVGANHLTMLFEPRIAAAVTSV
jgi:lipase